MTHVTWIPYKAAAATWRLVKHALKPPVIGAEGTGNGLPASQKATASADDQDRCTGEDKAKSGP